MILDYRVRWLGLIPLTMWIFHVVYNCFVRMQPAYLLWMCHVSALLLAVGLIASYASLIRLVAAWTVLGLPIWMLDAIATGATRISVLSHLLVPLTAVVAMSQVRGPRSPLRATAAAFAYYVVLQLIARFTTPPTLNVNLAFQVYEYFASELFTGYAAYWTIVSSIGALLLFGINTAFARKFPIELEEVAEVPPRRERTNPSQTPSSPEAPVKKQATSPGMLPPKAPGRVTTAIPKPKTSTSEPTQTPMSPGAGPRVRGFTLLEMMIVVSILGVLAALAVPDLSPAVHNAKLRSSLDEVVNFLERARRNARAEGRCHRVEVQGNTTMVMSRRDTADCFTAADLGTGWTEVARASVPAQGMTYDMETTAAVAAPASEKFIIFRPNGRLRGDGDLDVKDDGGRIYVTYDKTANIGVDVIVTSFGRICGNRVGSRPAALSPAVPVTCAVGFFDSGSVLAAGSFGGGGGGPPLVFSGGLTFGGGLLGDGGFGGGGGSGG